MIFFLILIAIIVTIVIINKTKYRNYEKVIGNIIEFIEEDNAHFPLFSFTTKDGKKIIARNKSIKEANGMLHETSVESAYTLEHAQSILSKNLPITDIPILYNKENPEDFIPKWL